MNYEVVRTMACGIKTRHKAHNGPGWTCNGSVLTITEIVESKEEKEPSSYNLHCPINCSGGCPVCSPVEHTGGVVYDFIRQYFFCIAKED